MPYIVNCQHYFYSGAYVVEIAYPGWDYTGSDMLATNYADEGEYADPREALEAAIRVRDQLQADYPDTEVGIAFGHFDLVEGEPQDLDDLKQEIEDHYQRLPKCDLCGDIIETASWIADDPDFGSFCSEVCAEKAYRDSLEEGW